MIELSPVVDPIAAENANVTRSLHVPEPTGVRAEASRATRKDTAKPESKMPSALRKLVVRIRPGNAGRMMMMRTNDTRLQINAATMNGKLKKSASSGLVTEICNSYSGPRDTTAVVFRNVASTLNTATTSMAV